MIARICDGADTPGLLRHLVSSGSSPTLVAHSDDRFIVERGWWDSEEWYRLFDEDDASILACDLDSSMTVALQKGFLCTPPRGTLRQYSQALQRTLVERAHPNHVWFCILALHPDDEAPSLETWRAIAFDIMNTLGWSTAPGDLDWPWVAIHNGRMPNGSDGLHLVANTIREDGAQWSRWRDQFRMQHALRCVEHTYDLRPLTHSSPRSPKRSAS